MAGRTRQTQEKNVKVTAAPDPTAALSAAIELFDEEFAKLNIHGKISAISGYLGRIPKNGHNNYNDYDYVLESDLVEAVRYYLAAARILIYPEAIREHTVYTFEGQTTGERNRQRDILTDSIFVWRVIDGRTGETFTFESNAQGSDPRDKGANKASTSGMKFAYLRLFNIASGEDAEADETGDQRQAQGPAQPDVKLQPGTVENVQRGGKSEKATPTQIKQISNLSNQLELGALGLVGVIKRVLDVTIELPENEDEHSKVLAATLKEQSGENAGKVIFALNEMVKATEVGAGADGGYGG